MGIKLSNNAFGTLAAGISNSATSITLTTGHGARFPSLSAGDYFYATLIDTSNNLEIVKCTARSTDVLTVVRAQESTTARAYSAGDRIEIRITAQTFVDAVNEIGPTQVSDEANTSTGYFDLPHGTTTQRPGSPSVGYTRYNTDLGLVETFHGVGKGWVALSNIFQATGGTESTYTSGGVTYKVHRFTSSGTFIVQSGAAPVDCLIVAGGGGAGVNGGGGGGAGGVIYQTSVNVNVNSYTVTIGGGGSSTWANRTIDAATNGTSSSALGYTAIGGGKGGHRSDNNNTVGGVPLGDGGAGGSGGGGGGQENTYSKVGGAGTSGQGYAGGAGFGGSNNSSGGGGGGAGGAGVAGQSALAGNGGVGVSNSITGTATYYGGGGGGSITDNGTSGTGGLGGGGNGGGNTVLGGNGTANTGGGGGGNTDDPNLSGGNGGSGIVIIRYAI